MPYFVSFVSISLLLLAGGVVVGVVSFSKPKQFDKNEESAVLSVASGLGSRKMNCGSSIDGWCPLVTAVQLLG